MKKIISVTVVALLLFTLIGGTPARAQLPGAGYYPTSSGGYAYYPPRGWVVPPPMPYYYGYGAGYRPYYGWSLPPYGFGSPYYNGYNDPYYYGYGPGVRDFLRMGGADFYGW